MALDVRITGHVFGRGEDLRAATNAYIDLIRKYRDELGDEEADKRLRDKANQVEPSCHLCASALDREWEDSR